MNSEPALIVIATIAVIVGVATLLIMRGRRQPKPQPQAAPERAPSSFLSGVVFIAVALILIVLLNSAYTAYEVQQSQHRWCDTLTLLTSHRVPKPSDPASNPSREQVYILQSDFISLRDGFGCG